MIEASIIVITDATDPRLEALVPMFEDLHAGLRGMGMMRQLAPDGARLWIAGVRLGLERFNRMVIAQQGDEVVGFTSGSIKLAPEYLGGAKVGHWTHIYVTAPHRRGGISHGMAEKMHEWFNEKGVSSIETEVARDHPSSVHFAESYGFQLEWTSLRKLL